MVAAMLVAALMGCQLLGQEPVPSPTLSAAPEPVLVGPTTAPVPVPTPEPSPTPYTPPTPAPHKGPGTGTAAVSEATGSLPVAVTTPTPVPTATVAPTPVPTATPAATATPPPTAAPTAAPTVTPTPMPMPTATPQATPTATPDPVAVALDYLGQLNPWVADPPDPAHARATQQLLIIWQANTSLGVDAAILPWVVDGISPAELATLETIGSFAGRDTALAGRLLGERWVTDGISEREGETLRWLRGWIKAPEMASVLLGYGWVRDGVTGREMEQLEPIRALASFKPATGLQVLALPWIEDGLTDQEARVLLEYGNVLEAAPDLAAPVAAFPWFAQDVNYDEAEVLYGLARIGRSDPELAMFVASTRWLAAAPEVNSHFWDPLDDLNIVANANPELAWRLASFLGEEFERPQRVLLNAFRGMIQEEKDAWRALNSRAWFLDGLSNEEMAFLTVATDILDNSPKDFFEMLDERYVESRTINLPQSGRVNIRLVSRAPFSDAERLLDDAAGALQLLEELTLLPLPTREVVILVFTLDGDFDFERSYSNLVSNWPVAAHGDGYIRLGHGDGFWGGQSTLYHELAHYYFNNFPVWFLEGGAEFAADYVWYHRHGSLEDWRSAVQSVTDTSCPSGARNIHGLGYPGFFYLARANVHCFYSMGRHLLASLYFALGPEVTSAALHEVFTYAYTGDSGPTTSKHIYLAFSRNLRPGQEREFQSIFGRLHGGPLSQSAVTGADDYANSPQQRVTRLLVGSEVNGKLDHALDTDYFLFAAEGGRSYELLLEHEIYNDYIGADLQARIHPPGGGEPELLRTRRGGEEGSRHLWIPRESGDYYLSLESSFGTTGAYSFQLGLPGAVRDDHGDASETATPIRIPQDETLQGVIDHPTDRDFFRVDVIEGWGYVAEVKNLTLDYSRVDVFDNDGQPAWNHQKGWGLRGSDVGFEAAYDGEYYLVVNSPEGNTGEYSITVTQHIRSTDDHWDSASQATELRLGQEASGVLDNEADKDLFRFPAVADRRYFIKIDHLTVTDQPVIIYGTYGETTVYEYRPWFRQYYGSYIPWVAPETGDFYVQIYSPDGDTGAYTLTVSQAAAGRDDHGATPEAATLLTPGVAAQGLVDGGTDVDLFQFEAQAGQRYELLLGNTHRDSRMSLFYANGVTSVSRFLEQGRRQSGKYLQWEARESGTYYVAVWGVEDFSAPYSLEVSPIEVPGS